MFNFGNIICEYLQPNAGKRLEERRQTVAQNVGKMLAQQINVGPTLYCRRRPDLLRMVGPIFALAIDVIWVVHSSFRYCISLCYSLVN